MASKVDTSAKTERMSDTEIKENFEHFEEIIYDNLLKILETRPRNPVSKFSKMILEEAGLDKNGDPIEGQEVPKRKEKVVKADDSEDDKKKEKKKKMMEDSDEEEKKVKPLTAEEEVVQAVIDKIWDTYDVDKSGKLDKEETKKFAQDCMNNLGPGEFDEEAFEEVFQNFDKNNNGTVERKEMIDFINKLLNEQ
jgi:hypothetical protein